MVERVESSKVLKHFWANNLITIKFEKICSDWFDNMDEANLMFYSNQLMLPHNLVPISGLTNNEDYIMVNSKQAKRILKQRRAKELQKNSLEENENKDKLFMNNISLTKDKNYHSNSNANAITNCNKQRKLSKLIYLKNKTVNKNIPNQEELDLNKNENASTLKKGEFVYYSRHKHASLRLRHKNGRFLSQEEIKCLKEEGKYEEYAKNNDYLLLKESDDNSNQNNINNNKIETDANNTISNPNIKNLKLDKNSKKQTYNVKMIIKEEDLIDSSNDNDDYSEKAYNLRSNKRKDTSNSIDSANNSQLKVYSNNKNDKKGEIEKTNGNKSNITHNQTNDSFQITRNNEQVNNKEDKLNATIIHNTSFELLKKHNQN